MKKYVLFLVICLFVVSCNSENTSDADGDQISNDGDFVESDFVENDVFDNENEELSPDGDDEEIDSDAESLEENDNDVDGDYDNNENIESCGEEYIEGNNNFCTSDLDCEADEICRYSNMKSSGGECIPMCTTGTYACSDGTICDSDINSDTYGHCVDDDSDAGKCIACDSDADCDENKYCYTSLYNTQACFGPNKCCTKKCESDDDCEFGLYCHSDGRCGVEFTNCGGQSCPNGYVCDELYDICVLNCPSCGPNECCDASSAPNCYVCSCTNPSVCGILLPPCCFGYCCSAIIYGVEGFCI